MGDLHEPDTRPAAAAAQPDLAERRRPGRPQDVAPALLPLLRTPHAAGASSEAIAAAEAAIMEDSRDSDDLGSARGMFGSVLLAAPFWVVVLYLMFR